MTIANNASVYQGEGANHGNGILTYFYNVFLLRCSWYFGAMSRQDSTDLLMAEREGGVFLVRDSATIQGDYVLCVRYDSYTL